MARWNSQLGGRSYTISNEQCAAMAHAGILGDTLWPIPPAPPRP